MPLSIQPANRSAVPHSFRVLCGMGGALRTPTRDVHEQPSTVFAGCKGTKLEPPNLIRQLANSPSPRSGGQPAALESRYFAAIRSQTLVLAEESKSSFLGVRPHTPWMTAGCRVPPVSPLRPGIPRTPCERRASRWLHRRCYFSAPWHFLYFFPDPQGHGSLRPTFSPVRR